MCGTALTQPANHAPDMVDMFEIAANIKLRKQLLHATAGVTGPARLTSLI